MVLGVPKLFCNFVLCVLFLVWGYNYLEIHTKFGWGLRNDVKFIMSHGYFPAVQFVISEMNHVTLVVMLELLCTIPNVTLSISSRIQLMPVIRLWGQDEICEFNSLRPSDTSIRQLNIHTCTSIGSYNCLSPGRRQTIILTSAVILLIGPLETNLSEILVEIYTFSFKKMLLKMSSRKWHPFCLCLNVLKWDVCCCGLDARSCYIGSLTCLGVSEWNK